MYKHESDNAKNKLIFYYKLSAVFVNGEIFIYLLRKLANILLHIQYKLIYFK